MPVDPLPPDPEWEDFPDLAERGTAGFRESASAWARKWKPNTLAVKAAWAQIMTVKPSADLLISVLAENSRGAWSELGADDAVEAGQGVTHAGEAWMALVDIDDPTSSEPSPANGDWKLFEFAVAPKLTVVTWSDDGGIGASSHAKLVIFDGSSTQTLDASASCGAGFYIDGHVRSGTLTLEASGDDTIGNPNPAATAVLNQGQTFRLVADGDEAFELILLGTTPLNSEEFTSSGTFHPKPGVSAYWWESVDPGNGGSAGNGSVVGQPGSGGPYKLGRMIATGPVTISLGAPGGGGGAPSGPGGSATANSITGADTLTTLVTQSGNSGAGINGGPAGNGSGSYGKGGDTSTGNGGSGGGPRIRIWW